MKNTILLSLVLLGLSTQLTFANQFKSTKNIYGQDDRVPLDTDAIGWRTIGKLSVGCTGTLVYRDLVLTAAHCILNGNSGQMMSGAIYFYPGYEKGDYDDSAQVVQAWWGTTNPDGDRGSDWAILKLNKPLGDKYGYLSVHGTNTSNFPGQLTVAGYSVNYYSAEIGGVHHDCGTKERLGNFNLIFHNCDTGRGSSGGPALRKYNGQLVVVGVNVAEKRYGGQYSLWVPQYSNQTANVVIPTRNAAMKITEITSPSLYN